MKKIFSLFFAFIISKLISFSSYPQAMLLSKKLDGNILIIGNSRTYRSFDLKYLQKEYNKKKVVNLSKDGNPSIISEINLKNFHNLKTFT